MKKHLLEKLQDFQNPQKPNRMKDTGLLGSREGKTKKKKISFPCVMWSSCWENLQICISALFARSLWKFVKWR